MRQSHATAVLDHEQLSDACMDDQALMRELVGSLIDDSTVQLITLRAAIDRDDCGECQRVAHYIKGACANLGAASMAAALLSIERQAAQGDFSACRATLAELSSELQKLRSEATSI
ncbi:MAG: Hpt domain-containing protein [Candidatus Solibacter usitatus]|nr:Hpt domain-containing protein [Candidatus Solibacter usitatus]